MNPYYKILGFVFVLAFILSIYGPPVASGGEPIRSMIPLFIDGKKIMAEVARTEGEKEKGLMFREVLPEDEGMLFIYEDEGFLSFWMKNTRIALSIAFIDSRGRIIDIQDMEPFSLASHTSRLPAKFALEMNRGWFQRNGIRMGNVVKIPPLPQKLPAR